MVVSTLQTSYVVRQQPGDLGHQTVGQGQQFDGVDRRLGGALLHLHLAGAALGGAGLEVGIAEPGDELQARPQTAPVVLVQQADTCRPCRSSPLSTWCSRRPGISPNRFSPGEPTPSARRWQGVWYPRVRFNGLKSSCSWPSVCIFQRKLPASLLLAATSRASSSSTNWGYSRLRHSAAAGSVATIVIALPHRVGEDGDVVLGGLPRVVERADGDRGHARLLLLGMDVDAQPVVFEHGDHRFGQLRVEVVGVHVDEIEHLLPAAARRAGEPAAGGPAQKTPRRPPAAAFAPGQCPASSPTATASGDSPAPNWPPGRPARPRRRAGRAASWPSRPAAARWRPRRPPCSRASAAEYPLPPDTPAGRQWQWTHRSATALNSSLVSRFRSSVPASTPRMRLAFARGEASSRGRDAEDRAHAELRRLRAALAAAIARRHGVAHPRRLPVQLQFDEVPQRRRLVGVLAAAAAARLPPADPAARPEPRPAADWVAAPQSTAARAA